MSMDYYVYLKHPDAFSAQSFEQYCSSVGLHVELHPSFNLFEDAGFYQFALLTNDSSEMVEVTTSYPASNFILLNINMFYRHRKRQQVSFKNYSKQSLSKKHPLIEQSKMLHG